jgi:iron(III) transport system permease protein
MAGTIGNQTTPAPLVSAAAIRGWAGRARSRMSRWLLAVLMVGIGLIALAPILIAIVSSFRLSLPGEPVEWGFAGWWAVFSSASIWQAIANTFILALMRVPLAVAAGAVLAWLLIRTNLPGRQIFEFLFWVAFFLPGLPMAMAWVLLLDPHTGWINLLLKGWLGIDRPLFNIYSYLGITWVHLTASTVPVMVILLGPAFRALDPAMEESARLCGASNAACLRRIVLPLVAPAIMTAAIAVLIRSLETFEIELYIGVPAGIRVYATKIYELAIWEPPRYAASMALSVPFIGILFVMALYYQRFLRKRQGGFATVGGRRAHAPPVNLGHWRRPAFVLCVVITGVIVVVPTATLLLGSFMKLFGVASANGGGIGFTTEHWAAAFHDSLFRGSIWNTLKLGIGAAGTGILVFSMIAYLLVRTNIAGRATLDLVVWLPWAIPGILLSLALLWMFLGTPLLAFLYGSVLGLVIAMVFKEMPIGVNLMKNSILQISGDLEDAARIAGANWWQTYWRLFFPLLAPTALSIGVLIFISCVKDISTMILLSTPETRPISILMLDYMTNGLVERGAVIGVISTFLTIGIAIMGRQLSRLVER